MSVPKLTGVIKPRRSAAASTPGDPRPIPPATSSLPGPALRTGSPRPAARVGCSLAKIVFAPDRGTIATAVNRPAEYGARRGSTRPPPEARGPTSTPRPNHRGNRQAEVRRPFHRWKEIDELGVSPAASGQRHDHVQRRLDLPGDHADDHGPGRRTPRPTPTSATIGATWSVRQDGAEVTRRTAMYMGMARFSFPQKPQRPGKRKAVPAAEPANGADLGGRVHGAATEHHDQRDSGPGVVHFPGPTDPAPGRVPRPEPGACLPLPFPQ